MVKKIIEKKEYHPDTYRIMCDECKKLFEAENDDFRYLGGNLLECRCPWCASVVVMTTRQINKAKIHYGASITYVV